MRFLWFRKKKKAAPPVEIEVVREPEEVFSVIDFQCITNPVAGSSPSNHSKSLNGIELSAQEIDSLILSLLSQAHSPADIAAQEFFQERGANVLPVRDYSFSPERGYSGRVQEADATRTVLIGGAAVIARATTPFCEEIAAAVIETPNAKVVAIDGIAYAIYSIDRELI